MGVALLAGAGRPAAHDSPCPASPGMKKLAVPDRQGDSGPESGDQNPSGFVNGPRALVRKGRLQGCLLRISPWRRDWLLHAKPSSISVRRYLEQTHGCGGDTQVGGIHVRSGMSSSFHPTRHDFLPPAGGSTQEGVVIWHEHQLNHPGGR